MGNEKMEQRGRQISLSMITEMLIDTEVWTDKLIKYRHTGLSHSFSLYSVTQSIAPYFDFVPRQGYYKKSSKR